MKMLVGYTFIQEIWEASGFFLNHIYEVSPTTYVHYSTFCIGIMW